MATDVKQLFSNDKADELIEAISNISISSTISVGVANALLKCFSKVAWIDGNGQQYYDELRNALENSPGETWTELDVSSIPFWLYVIMNEEIRSLSGTETNGWRSKSYTLNGNEKKIKYVKAAYFKDDNGYIPPVAFLDSNDNIVGYEAYGEWDSIDGHEGPTQADVSGIINVPNGAAKAIIACCTQTGSSQTGIDTPSYLELYTM